MAHFFSVIARDFSTTKFARSFGWPQNCVFLMSNYKWPILLVLFAVVLGTPTFVDAAEASLAAKLQGRLTANWHGQQLHAVLQRIAETQGISLWVDRRVDLQHIVNAQFTDAQLSAALDEVLDEAHLGWAICGKIIYIGPTEAAREIATLAAIARQSLDKLPSARRTNWMKAKGVSWPRLSDPREVLAGWLADAEISIKNPEVLSHDLWDAARLPPLPLVDRVVLLLLGYDKTCLISASGQSLEIVPIARPVLITEEYQPGRQMRDLLAAFRDDPIVVLNRQGNRVAITGRWEDQQRARQIIKGSRPNRETLASRPGRTQEQRFSLKLENQPVGKVIDQLAGQLGLSVSWQGNAVAQREQLTSCEIKDGTLEGLLEAVLTPVGLGFSLEDKQLTILPGK